MTDTTTKATKVRVLVDATVEADMSEALLFRTTPERKAKRLEEMCEEFHEHVRDHRSLDHITLTVNRVVEDQCSACHREWETMREEDGSEICANCGAAVEP